MVAMPQGRIATRRVDAIGIVEEIGFVESGGRQMFSALHRPEGASNAAVVICSPIQAEQLRNYRREVLLARELARQGLTVQRFHYRGSGNSDGSPADVTFETMLEDARTALRLLRERADGAIALVGTRLGAAVAAIVGREAGARALVMWEPLADTDRYFREIFRGRLVSELKHGESHGGRSPIDELRRSGQLDILGYSIDLPLYESVIARRPSDDLVEVPPHVLLVQIGGPSSLRPDYRALASAWSERGTSVLTHRLEGAEPWWFGSAPDMAGEEPDRAHEMVEVTSGWMLHAVATPA